MDVLNLSLVFLLAFSVALINALNTMIENARKASKERHAFDLQKIAVKATNDTAKQKELQESLSRFIDRYYSYSQVDLLRSVRALKVTILGLALGFLLVSFKFRGDVQQNIRGVDNEMASLQASPQQVDVIHKYVAGIYDPFFYSALVLVLLLILLSLGTFLLLDVSIDLKELFRPSIIGRRLKTPANTPNAEGNETNENE